MMLPMIIEVADQKPIFLASDDDDIIEDKEQFEFAPLFRRGSQLLNSS